MNMVYQDLVKMQVQMQQNIVQAGERKYEYDSDEDTEASEECSGQVDIRVMRQSIHIVQCGAAG